MKNSLLLASLVFVPILMNSQDSEQQLYDYSHGATFENLFVIQDPADDAFPIKLWNLQDSTMKGIPSGFGPGELHPIMAKYFSFSSIKDVYIYDPGKYFMSVYDSTLNFKGNVNGLGKKSIFGAYIMNDSLLVTIPSTGDLFEVYRVDEDLQATKITSFPTSTFKEFQPFEVPLWARQSTFFSNLNGSGFFAFRFSNYIIEITTDLSILLHKPTEGAIPFPIQKKDSFDILPPSGENPEGIIGMTGSGDKLFLLHKSETIPTWRIITYMFNMEQLETRLFHSDELFVFDISDKSFSKLDLKKQVGMLGTYKDEMILFSKYEGEMSSVRKSIIEIIEVSKR